MFVCSSESTWVVLGKYIRRFPKLGLLPFCALIVCEFKQKHGSNNPVCVVFWFLFGFFFNDKSCFAPNSQHLPVVSEICLEQL